MTTGFILAAGFGTRLRPLTDHLPKALVPVCGVTLAQRALEALRRSGFTRIGVNCHHLADQMLQFRETSPVAFELFHETGAIRGTGGALHFAREFLASDTAFLVCNVDILSTVDCGELGSQFDRLECDCALVAVPVASGGTILYDPATLRYVGTVQDAAPGPHAEPAEFIGMALYRPRFLQAVRADDFSIVPVWRRAMSEGYSVKVIAVPNTQWRDIGSPRSYAQVHFDVLSGAWNLDVPKRLTVDRRCGKAFPANAGAELIERLGASTWFEEESLPEGLRIERSVVLRHAQLANANGAILTPWGSIAIDTV